MVPSNDCIHEERLSFTKAQSSDVFSNDATNGGGHVGTSFSGRQVT